MTFNMETRIIGNDDAEADRILEKYQVPKLYKAYIEVGPDKYCMPIAYKEWAEHFYKFEVRDDDVYVMGFPRTGTTWIQEMVWLIINDLNFVGAKKYVWDRSPLLESEIYSLRNDKLIAPYPDYINILDYINRLKSPRCLKTHLQWSLLPEEITNGSKHPKIIYMLRNPKDVCGSYYNLYRLFYGYTGNFEDFCTLFLEAKLISTPFWKSVLSFWKQRHRSNILFIGYKDMKEDLRCVIKKVSNFVGKQLDEMQTQLLVDHLDIENMRNNSAVNYDSAVEHFSKHLNLMISDKNNFIGKGEQNGYLSIMSPELVTKFDEWTKKHLDGTDLIIE